VNRCRTGDELAWEVLVRRFQPRVYSVAFHYLGQAEEAKDVAQDIFVRAYEQIDGCREPERFLPWIIRIARNACIDRLRQIRARPPAQDLPVEDMADRLVAATSPEEVWERNRRKQLIHRAVQSMSTLNREVIVLKEIQGLSLKEIARVLEVPMSTVNSRATRARLELAQKVVDLSGGSHEATVRGD
jgi:RNA polymerase sigma-70 factor (ECF subfamily)